MYEWIAEVGIGVPVPDLTSGGNLRTLLYFTGASLITLGVETLRRWVKIRMDAWEASHAVPPISADNGKDSANGL